MRNQFKLKLLVSPVNVLEGGAVTLKAILSDETNDIPVDLNDITDAHIKYDFEIQQHGNVIGEKLGQKSECFFTTSGWIPGNYRAICSITGKVTEGVRIKIEDHIKQESENNLASFISGHTESIEFSIVTSQVQAAVTMRRTEAYPTDDQALWVAIRNRTIATDFKRYDHFLKNLFSDNDLLTNMGSQAASFLSTSPDSNNFKFTIHGPYAYEVLKLATQVFLTLQCGVVIDPKLFDQNLERIRLNDSAATLNSINQHLKNYLQLDNPAVLPYLDRIVDAMVRLDSSTNKEVLPFYQGILMHRMTAPSMIELIWSYWEEEGMLMQTMNAVALRFQNIRRSAQDPLGEFEINPLQSLNVLMWGHIQAEHNRLTVPRRAYEYDHHYGLKMVGKAVPSMMSADSRSKFIEAFHNLLYRTAIFYKEDAETTVIADAFPLLNALREVHLLLAEGAHNQFGDLPWTARAEMLMTQWLLARPEMREFLRGRHMVPYQEPWMGAVDSMKKLQGWTDTSITHFHELAVTGERIVLSVRYGDWSDINNIEDMAKNWARYWKADIQRYIHGYMSVAGVDLMAEVTSTREASQRSLQPSTLMKNRLIAQQKGQGRIPVMTRAVGAIASDVSGYVEAPAIGRSRLLRYKAEE